MAKQPKVRFIMYERIREQCDLAATYAEDGAYHSAARVLAEIAAETQAHADRVMPMPPKKG